MVTLDTLRQLALALPETTVEKHFDKVSFRVRDRIFATYDDAHKRASVKLCAAEQRAYATDSPEAITPAPNTRGGTGWTLVDLSTAGPNLLAEVLKCAYCEVAPRRLADIVRGCSEEE